MTDTVTSLDLDLDAIRRRAHAATPGPWTLRNGWGPASDGLMRFVRIANADHDSVLEMPDDTGELVATQNDAEFIAHARQDIPALLAEVDRLRAEVAFYEGPQKQPGRISLVPRPQRAPLYAAYKAAEEWADQNGESYTDDGIIQAAVKAYRAELIAQAKQAGTNAAKAVTR